jgi:hypothetical protein
MGIVINHKLQTNLALDVYNTWPKAVTRLIPSDTIFNHIITVDYSITHLTYLSFGKGPTKIGYNSSLSIVADVIFLLLQ